MNTSNGGLVEVFKNKTNVLSKPVSGARVLF